MFNDHLEADYIKYLDDNETDVTKKETLDTWK